MAGKHIYLAGPDVFWPNATEAGAAKAELCREFGFSGHFPLDTALELADMEPFQAGIAIYTANIELMNKCDLIIANMTPFRGPSMDAGTAFEIGYMTAQDKPVWGYSLDGRLYSDRVPHQLGIDSEGMSVEAFAMVDNLMMVGAVDNSDGMILTPPSTQPFHSQNLDSHLHLFRTLLERIHAAQR